MRCGSARRHSSRSFVAAVHHIRSALPAPRPLRPRLAAGAYDDQEKKEIPHLRRMFIGVRR